MLLLILLILGIVLGYFAFQACTQAPSNSYGNWVADIRQLNPEFKAPWCPNGQRNPEWVEGQVIKQPDGTSFVMPTSPKVKRSRGRGKSARRHG